MKNVGLVIAALALAGCSFIDDWSTLTAEPAQPMDGGATDSGRADGGSDACVHECNVDTQSGCDVGGWCTRAESCGTVCIDCAGVCDACPTTCIAEPVGACYCPGEAEGSPCTESSVCGEGLGCLNGICRRQCLQPGQQLECEAALGPNCVSFAEGSFCADETCNPLENDGVCSPGGCAIVDAATVCVGVGALRENEACDGGGCPHGLMCASTAPGSGTWCLRLCDTVTSEGCDPQFSTNCVGTGYVLSDGTQVGVCAPRDDDGDGVPFPFDCDDASASVHPEAHDECDAIDNDCDGITDNPRCVADSDCCGADTCSPITLRCE